MLHNFINKRGSKLIFLLLIIGIVPVVITSCNKVQSTSTITKPIEKPMEKPVEKPKEDVVQATKDEKENLIPYDGVIENIFFHPLILDTKEAFKGGYKTNDLDDWFITVDEFNKVIDSLYKKNFILVDTNSIYEEYEVNGKKLMRRKKLMIPEGKRPLIISIDDLSYNEGMRGSTADKLILDKDGNIATYRKRNGQEIIGYDEVTILVDKFVEKHPDFSLNGQKGTIALTGYEGILGYRTEGTSNNRDNEVEEAKKVVKKLKENGWTFASHSYGHNNHNKMSYEKIKYDADKWEREVGSIVGKTQIYIYPHGFNVKEKDSRFQYLQSKGFRIFYSVGKEPYVQISKESPAVKGDRMAVDGITLRNRRQRFLKFYDAKDVIDLNVRPKRPYNFD